MQNTWCVTFLIVVKLNCCEMYVKFFLNVVLTKNFVLTDNFIINCKFGQKTTSNFSLIQLKLCCNFFKLPTTTLEGDSKKFYSVKFDIHLRITLPPR